MQSCTVNKPIPINYAAEIQHLKRLIACLIKDVQNLTTIIQTPDKPPIFIPWAEFEMNKYINPEVKDQTFVVFLNGGRFLHEDVDYSVLPEGGFQLTAPELVDIPNDYVLIR